MITFQQSTIYFWFSDMVHTGRRCNGFISLNLNWHFIKYLEWQHWRIDVRQAQSRKQGSGNLLLPASSWQDASVTLMIVTSRLPEAGPAYICLLSRI